MRARMNTGGFPDICIQAAFGPHGCGKRLDTQQAVSLGTLKLAGAGIKSIGRLVALG